MVDYMNIMDLAHHPHYRWNATDVLDDTSAKQDHSQALNIAPHDLFRRNAWRNFAFTNRPISRSLYMEPKYDISVDYYLRIYPALQLATILIERAYPFFVRIVRAPVFRLYQRKPHFDALWAPQDADYQALHDELLELAKVTSMFLVPENENLREEDHAIGLSAYPRNEDAMLNPLGSFPPRLMHIGVSAPLLLQMNDDTWVTKTDIQRATILAELALTLVHELAHALWRRRRDVDQPRDTREPMFWDEGYFELGHAVTKFLFGLEVGLPSWIHRTREEVLNNSLNRQRRPQFDGAAGLIGIKLVPNRDLAPESYVLTFQTIFSMFDRTTWDDDRPFSMVFLPIVRPSDLTTTLLDRVRAVWADETANEASHEVIYGPNPLRAPSIPQAPDMQQSTGNNNTIRTRSL